MADEKDIAASMPSGQDDDSVSKVEIAENPQRRRGRRSRAEVEAERAKLRAEIEIGLDALVVAMHLLLPRSKASEVGAAYARYSTDFQHSIIDQIRAIYERAIALGIFIPRDQIYYDMAMPGCKERRPGLEQLKAALDAKKAGVLLVFTTNRLFRKLYKAMKFVEEEIVGRKLRAIFIRTNIDTAETDRWRLPLQVNALVDEMTSTMYAENIRAAHEGLFINGYVVYTLAYGYMGKDVKGKFTKRQRPRQIPIIDEELAEWVRKIFQWYVIDRMKKQRILERLNELQVPCGPKSDGSYWTDQALTYLLENECYRGLWSYGKGQNVWQAKADYSKRVLRKKPLRQAQFEHLRLVSDEIWFGAQKLLAESQAANPNAGRKSVDGNTVTRPRLLNGLLYCYHHNCRLKVGGDNGKHMVCMRCRTLPKADRPLYSYLNRRDALRGLCSALAGAIRGDVYLIARLMAPFKDEAAALQSEAIGDLDRGKRHVDKLTQQIMFTLDNVGETEEDQKESQTRLKILRAERALLAADVARDEARRLNPKAVPTEAEFRTLVAEMEQVLLDAATSDEPADVGALRALLELLTGSRIVVEQGGERLHSRGWPVLRVQVHLLQTCWTRANASVSVVSDPLELVVELRPQTIAEEKQADVIPLYIKGMLVSAIAEQTGIDRHQVTAAAKLWCKANNVPYEDGRRRRGTVPQKSLKPPVTQQIADDAKRLLDKDLLIEEIATKLKRGRDTVREALRFWHEQRGLPMPDMRNRRKTLAIKNRPKEEPKD